MARYGLHCMALAPLAQQDAGRYTPMKADQATQKQLTIYHSIPDKMRRSTGPSGV